MVSKKSILFLYLLTSLTVTLFAYEYYWQKSIDLPFEFNVESPYTDQIYNKMAERAELTNENQGVETDHSRLKTVELELEGLIEKNSKFFAEHKEFVNDNYRAEDYFPARERVLEAHGLKILLIWLVVSFLFYFLAKIKAK